MPSPGARLFDFVDYETFTQFQIEVANAADDTSTAYELDGFTRGFRGQLTGTGDMDWIRHPAFNFTSGQMTARAFSGLDVVGINGTDTGDLQLRIYRSNGAELVEEPDLATGIATRRLFAPDNNSDFYVEISSVSGGPAEYELRPVSIGLSYWGDDARQNWRGDGISGVVYGFGGDDTLNPGGNSVLVYAGDGNDSVAAGSGSGIYFGGNGNDTLISAATDYELYGEAGDDVLRGGLFLHGGAGNDQVRLTGDDGVIVGGSGHDHLSGSLGDDRVYGGGDAGQDTIAGSDGDDTIFAGGGDDIVYGGVGHDRLRGGDGDDTLLGLNDNDVIHGGAGADNIRGGIGFDTADYRATTQGMTLDLNDQTNNAGAAGGDMLTSIEAIRGTNFADQITGNAFRNVLHGRGGDDTLTGGGGEDVFVFTVGGGADVITDFEAGEDILRIASGTIVSVADDGTDTTVTHGSDSVVLQDVVLSESEIDIAFF